jgi:hypothetical protein
MTKTKTKEWECKQHFSKGLSFIVLARCCRLLSHNEIRDNGCKCNTSFSKTDKYLTFLA